MRKWLGGGDLIRLDAPAGIMGDLFPARKAFIPIYHYTKLTMTESTTVKVSKETVKKLVALQRSLHTGSMDETIEALVRRRRKDVLDAMAGTDPVKTRKFSERDRFEDRS